MQFPAIARFPRLLVLLHSRRLTSSARCQAAPMSSHQSKPLQSLRVAVLGAGAGGLVAARELLREGHQVTVFEKGSTVGGVWVYTDDVESDPLGLHPKRRRVHSSMYAGLRTNLPREVMAYSDFAFDDLGGKSEDARRFPSHKEVLNYLQAFATTFDLEKHITFNTQVVRAQPLFRAALPSNGSNRCKAAAEPPTDLKEAAEHAQGIMPWPRWRLTTIPTSEAESTAPNAGTEAQQRRQQQEEAGAAQQLEFDAVVACSGHYSEPRIPLLLRSDARVLGPDDKLRGADVFPGRLMHSHNYRRPEEFAGKTVMLLGASSSGADICHEVAEHACQVYLCARTYVSEAAPFGAKSNIWRRPPPLELHEDGRISFADGTTSEAVDTVMFCTGYRYSYPFLAPTDLVDVAENRVHPVYKHVFSINAAPTLAFIGLPFKVVPFPQMELVAKWIARVLSGRSQLPTMMAMRQDSRSLYEHLRMQGMPVRYTHLMDGDTQWRYNNWLAEQCGEEGQPLGAWRQQMYESTSENKRRHPEKYRDVFQYGQLPDAAQRETHDKQAAALRQTDVAA